MTDDTGSYRKAIDAWRADRRAALTAPNGWLTLIARHPLAAGTYTVGSAADATIALPVGPAHLATLVQDEAGSVVITPADGGAPVQLTPNKKAPPRLMVGTLELELTTLNGENALRVRDTLSPVPAAFPPIVSYPVRPDLRIVADWVAFDAPQALTVDTSKAIATDVEATHKAVFEIDGRTVELVATHGTPTAPQFVFRDQTALDETYPACRFVYGEDVTENTIVIDFNKAINPPCAYTEFAICPLPPPENVLPFRIEAGEKRPAK